MISKSNMEILDLSDLEIPVSAKGHEIDHVSKQYHHKRGQKQIVDMKNHINGKVKDHYSYRDREKIIRV